MGGRTIDQSFSPMTLSRRAVNNGGSEGQGSGWPVLQGHLNIMELYLPNDKVTKQFKNLGDNIISASFLEKYCVNPLTKKYFIFFKGKLYKFKGFNENDSDCHELSIKYCQIDLISIQKPNQTVVFGGKFGGNGNASWLNLEQCIIIRYTNKVVVLTAPAS